MREIFSPENASCEIIEFDRLNDDEPVMAFFPPVLHVAGQMPDPPEAEDDRPFLEFAGPERLKFECKKTHVVIRMHWT